MLYTIFTPVFFLIACGGIFSSLLVFAEKIILNYGPCKVIVNNSKNFEIQGGSSLLSSLATKDIFIPSACGGRGSCAYCKVEVSEGGGYMNPIEKSLLNTNEISSNFRLSCQVKIRNDIKIKIPEELFYVKKYKAILSNKKPLTYDILELTLKIIEPKYINFKAGQYIQMESKEYLGKSSVMRAYSISSLPSSNTKIQLITRRAPEGVCTSWIFDHFKKGEEVYFSGPYGQFILSNTSAPIIFIAGGSGMAPIWSMLQYMIDKDIIRKTIFFFGAVTQKDIFYKYELDNLSNKYDWFDFVPALSNEPSNSNWFGKRGLITDIVRQYVLDTSNYEAYLCGSPGMINACISVLVENGMSENNIYYDKFA